MRPCSRRSWMLVGVLVVVLCSLLLMPWGGSGAIAAKGAAAKKAPTVVKELTDKRTADSETFLLSNGSMRSDLYAKPIHYKDAKGVWQNIDTTLVPDTHPGEFVSRATPVSVTVQSAGAPTVSLGYLGKTLTLSLNGGGGSLSLPAAPAGAQPGSTTSPTLLSPGQTTPLTSAALASPHNVLVGDALTRLAADTAVTYQMTADSQAGSSSTTDSSTTSTSDSSTTTTANSTTTSQAATTDTTQATTTSLAQPVGDTVTFTGVSGDTDLSCQVTPDGVKENLVLSSASAPDTFTFTLSHPGLILRQDERGQWGFYMTGEDPKPILLLEAPLVYDSSQDSLGDPAYSDGAAMTVTPGTGESTVTYSIPESWLTDPARVYPVTLDPSVNQSANPDTFIDQGYPSTPYSGLDHMSAGNFGSPDNWTTGLLQFALPDDLNNGAVVQSADLYLHQYYQSTSTAEVARISAMTKDWSASDTYSSLGSTSWFGSQTVSVATTTAQTQTLDFPVKSIVQEWADNALPNYGFTLYQNQADSQSGRNWYRRVYSNEAAQANRPVLSITYTLPYNVQTAYHADGIASDYHDDTTAFQTAINDASAAGGGTVYVPAGTYYVKDTLTLSGSNVKLLGAGTNSIIQSFSETDSPPKAQAQLITLGGSSASSNLSIQSLNLRVPKAGNAIRITGSASITGVHIVGNIFSGGADSSSTSVVSCDATNFSDLDISGNDLSLVTCVPFTFASQTGSRSIFQNTMPATKPYTSDGVVGSDGYDAAIRESNFDYANPTSTVVLVTGQNYSLGASAAVLAGAYGGPVLLTHESSLDTSTQTEIERLGPSTVYVVGLSSTIATQAGDSLPNCTVVNETGSNDNATAATIATTVKNKLGMPNTVLIIPSDDSAVGTAVAAEAAAKGYPVLLTPAAGPLPSETSGWYQANVTNSILEVGTSVSLPGLTTQTRVVINGTDDYDTANQYASNAVTYWNSTYAYTGLASAASGDWQYSVGAGASLGKHNGVMLLANGQTPSTQAASALAAHCAQIQHLVYLNEYLPYQTDQVISPWMPSAPQHTIYGLREFADHNASATLDTRALSVQTTDLTVASFGPDASLSRIYSSTNTSATYFAPGWRFDFEQKLTFPANQETDYTNPLGDVQKFIYGSGVWTAASGYSGRLTYNAGPPVTWSLAFPEGDTLTFDANGHLMSDADSNGNTTTYTWTNGYVTTITAANGQTISLTLNGGNRVATYATSAGTRTVTYSQAAPWTVAYSYSGGTSTPSRSLTYGYTSSLLTGVTASAFTSAGDSIEGFSYTGTDLTGVTYPDYASNADSCVGISNGSQTATVTTKGTVYNPSTKTDAAGTAVTQTYTWNASGTTAS